MRMRLLSRAQGLALLICTLTGFPETLARPGGQGPETRQIIEAYEKWKELKTRKREYAKDSECNPNQIRILLQAARLGEGDLMGFGSASFSFADINQDGVTDALTTFNPKQCDGGNASMHSQVALLILSKNARHSYKVDDQTLENLHDDQTLRNLLETTEGWFLRFQEVQGNGIVSGTAYAFHSGDKFKPGDARCCPSIWKAFTYTYLSKRVTLK